VIEKRAHGKWSKKNEMPPELIFLCDGLDEMPREQLDAFISWIRGLPPKTCAVIATRPGMAHVTNLPYSRQFSICPFSDEQIELFVNQWFKQNQDLGTSFLREIKLNQAIRSIVRIPLLLTFLSLKVEASENPVFPKDLKEIDLLQEIIEILFERWDAYKTARPVDIQMLQLGMTVFERLAVRYAYGTVVYQEQLEHEIAETVTYLKLSREYHERFIQRIEGGMQIMQGDRDSGYFFIHKIFFDFFFSRHLVRIVSSSGGNSGYVIKS
jgi:hypothetical protein